MLKELISLSEKARGRPMSVPATNDKHASKARSTGVDTFR